MTVHVLTDLDHGIWLDRFDIVAGGASIRKRTLHGGLSDGVDVIDVDNGVLSFSVLPTRGMGLWRGRAGDMDLGWKAPVRGPVHPKFVNVAERAGLGWLTGFDEWLCRCGLNWNGPPGDDNGRPLTLHGRIANQPAHRVEVAIDPNRISIHGEVEEAGLFHSRLRLKTTYTTNVGSSRLDIRDEVTNLGATPAEMQLLYHVNQGLPLLGEGSRVHVPYRELWPMTAHAAAGLDRWTEYSAATLGFVEQVYCMFPAANADGKSLALLHDPDGNQAMALRWSVAELPCFTIWKNTAAIEDGYVTGLEPATNFPRFKTKEREAGRVVNLAPRQTWCANWSIEVAATKDAVSGLVREVEQIQATIKPVVHSEPMN
jgi:Domain of unknown function (DUF4432)